MLWKALDIIKFLSLKLLLIPIETTNFYSIDIINHYSMKVKEIYVIIDFQDSNLFLMIDD